MLGLLGIATAATAWFPHLSGILTITLLSSIGFHFFETVNQSLQLQWFSKEEAPGTLAKLMAIGSAATLIAYICIIFGWDKLNISFLGIIIETTVISSRSRIDFNIFFSSLEESSP